MKKVLMVVAAIIVSISVAFAARDVNNHSDKAHKHAGPESDFTLMQVMHDLTAQLSRIQFGIMTNNRLMIAEGAKAIAHHPAPKGGIKPYIKKNAEMVKETIPAMDKLVHETAVKMFKASKTESMHNLQEMANTISGGCVGCHDFFRD